mgnify:CR=1 FL=1
MRITVTEHTGEWLSAGETCSTWIVQPFTSVRDVDGTIVSETHSQAVKGLIDLGVFSGKKPEARALPTPLERIGGIVAVFIGRGRQRTAENLRRAASQAYKCLEDNRARRAMVAAGSLRDQEAAAFTEGLVLASYHFDQYKSKDNVEDRKPRLEQTAFSVTAGRNFKTLETAITRAAVIAEGANAARRLGDTAANDLPPRALAAFACGIAEKFPHCACEVLGPDILEKLGMNALLGVGKGSSEPPALILLTYCPPKAKRHVAIVGKGVCFDSGGISLKPPQSMHEMKYDMSGAGAALCALMTAAELRLPVNLTVAVPAAENKTGSAAQTPGDIVRAYNGKTIEVHNTDAEGRLLLADALAYTIRRFKPECVIDLATLTGACVIALGHHAAGIMGTDQSLINALIAAGEATGERLWQLPLWEDHDELIRGEHADINNVGPAREAGAIVGAAFLKQFTGKTPWAHLDIAGTAYGVKKVPYWNEKYATGFGVRLLVHWLSGLVSGR